MTGRTTNDHYSYTLYADPETARTFDDRRFGGPVGELVAGTQARVLLEFLGPVQDRRILDVGTGTGRAALLLARAGAKVTGIDASEPMLEVARTRAPEQGVGITFRTGDAQSLEFPDRSFDATVSFRVLMHTPRWRQCISELCRVSDQLVIVDYPASRSVAALQSAWRGVIHAFGVRTEPYRVFSHADIEDAFKKAGFAIRSVHKQFVLPIALHKAISSPRFTLATENILGRVGLRNVVGSPVTLVAERCGPS